MRRYVASRRLATPGGMVARLPRTLDLLPRIEAIDAARRIVCGRRSSAAAPGNENERPHLLPLIETLKARGLAPAELWLAVIQVAAAITIFKMLDSLR